VRRDIAEPSGFELLSQLRKRVRVAARRAGQHREAESGRDRRRDTIGMGHELEHDGDNFGAHITLRDRDAEQAMPGRNVEHLERFGRRLRDEIRNGLSFGMYRSSGQA